MFSFRVTVYYGGTTRSKSFIPIMMALGFGVEYDQDTDEFVCVGEVPSK